MGSWKNNERPVAVTGIGMVTPVGVSTDECWRNMVAGRSGIRRVKHFDVSGCMTRIGGELPDAYFALEKRLFADDQYGNYILPMRLSVYTARQAAADASILDDPYDPYRCAVITGCGGSTFGDRLILHVANVRKEKSNEMINSLGAAVSLDLGFRGPSYNLATACASGAFAVCAGADYIREGGELCVAIGIDTILVKETLEGFNQLMALSEENDEPDKASRPFDKTRSGFVLSEGACAVVLESLERALARGARIYALISGHACTSEAFNIIAPEPEGRQMARTMTLALQRAGREPAAIGYINAHGTSTPHNDVAETKAIKRAFGEWAYRIPVSSQKSMIGHSIGAAGAIEFGVTALSLYHQRITPTINYRVPDPECDLDYVPNTSREVEELNAAITNSFGFGGHNCTIVVERFRDN